MADHVHASVQTLLEVDPIPAQHAVSPGVAFLKAEHQPPAAGRPDSALRRCRRGRARHDRHRSSSRLQRESELAGDRLLPQAHRLTIHDR